MEVRAEKIRGKKLKNAAGRRQMVGQNDPKELITTACRHQAVTKRQNQ